MDGTETLEAWIGRTETREDVASPVLADRIAALLDRPAAPAPGEDWPLAWVWALFAPALRPGMIGPDGHARRGGFLPPVPLPRRMWAGSVLECRRPARVGETLRRVSTITDVAAKTGRSGRLVFVTVDHRIEGASGADLSDRHTIVYREIAPPGDAGGADTAPEPLGFEPEWRRRVEPDPVLLFQYSAVTFNTHRIHYDADHVRNAEHYPGLVVHGPLIATYLLELVAANRPERAVAGFTFRALRPIFVPTPFDLVGRADGDRFVTAAVADGRVAMRLEGRFDS